jgi:hypothetical protein
VFTESNTVYSLLEQSTGGVCVQIPISSGQITRAENFSYTYVL